MGPVTLMDPWAGAAILTEAETAWVGTMAVSVGAMAEGLAVGEATVEEGAGKRPCGLTGREAS